MAVQRHLFPGSDRPAPRRERQLHHVPGRKLVHPADLAGGRAHQSRRLAAGDPALHRVPRASFPTTWASAGCLNLAHMTLGEYPDKVDPRFLISLDRFRELANSTSAGSATSATAWAWTASTRPAARSWTTSTATACSTWPSPRWTRPMAMAFYRNRGDGTFEDRSEPAGVTGQLGGLVCYQTDYNNDGRLDIFIPRGAWLPYPIRPSLLRNDGGGRFTDVTGRGRAARPGQFQRGGLGRLRQRRLARPLHRLREAAQPPVSQPRRRHVRGGRRKAGVDGKDQDNSTRAARGSTTTTTVIPTCSSTA